MSRTPVDPNLKIAREQTKRELISGLKEIAVVMAQSPIMQMIAGVMVVEVGQMIRPNGKNQLISGWAGNTIETVLITTETLKAASDAVGGVAGIKNIMGLFGK